MRIQDDGTYLIESSDLVSTKLEARFQIDPRSPMPPVNLQENFVAHLPDGSSFDLPAGTVLHVFSRADADNRDER